MSRRGPKAVHARRTVEVGAAPFRIVAVADTHGRPHPLLDERLAELGPAHILHAGDVGDLAVLRGLEKRAPVTAVRGNIDPRDLPDSVALEVGGGAELRFTILLTHVAVAGPRLRADVARLARAEGASLVVCGHSHVPFAAHDGGLGVFNPGSVGPRRFRLPIVLGVIDVSATGAAVRHVDCETGRVWKP
jgi:putative phosphoesterase